MFCMSTLDSFRSVSYGGEAIIRVLSIESIKGAIDLKE